MSLDSAKPVKSPRPSVVTLACVFVAVTAFLTLTELISALMDWASVDMQTWLRPMMGTWAAILLQGLVFGLVHAGPEVVTLLAVGTNLVLALLLVLVLGWGVGGSAAATAVAELVQAVRDHDAIS